MVAGRRPFCVEGLPVGSIARTALVQCHAVRHDWPGLAAFFNLPITSVGLTRSIAYADEVSEYGLTELGIIDFWMELHP